MCSTNCSGGKIQGRNHFPRCRRQRLKYRRRELQAGDRSRAFDAPDRGRFGILGVLELATLLHHETRPMTSLPIAFRNRLVYITWMLATNSQLPVGRPREFDLDEAVRRAMQVFWDRGYHDASLPDLLAGMKLSKGSFYKAFGDKKSVFLRALELYTDDGVRNVQEVLRSDPSPKAAIRNAFIRYADLSSGSKGVRGCFAVLTAAEMLPGDPEIAGLIKRLFARLQDLFAATVAKGQAAGEIRNSCDPRVIAHFIVSHAQGMRVLGKVGSSRDEMLKNIDLLMETVF